MKISAGSTQLPSLTSNIKELTQIYNKLIIPRKHAKSLSSYHLIDFSMSKKIIKPSAPYHQSKRTDKSSILSSKVDFFDPTNEHRLKVSRNKTIQQKMGFIANNKKPKIITSRRSRKFMSPQLHSLLKDYLTKKQQDDEKQAQYLIVGRNQQRQQFRNL